MSPDTPNIAGLEVTKRVFVHTTDEKPPSSKSVTNIVGLTIETLLDLEWVQKVGGMNAWLFLCGWLQEWKGAKA